MARVNTKGKSDEVAALLLAEYKKNPAGVARVTTEDGIEMAAYLVQLGHRDRLVVDPKEGTSVRFAADITIPPYMVDGARQRIHRVAQGLRVESVLQKREWGEQNFLFRAATVHHRMVPLKALWDARSEVYLKVLDLRGQVGKRQLARMSAAVANSGRVTTEDYSKMTAGDCHYWLGWACGALAGLEARLARVKREKSA